VSIQDRLKAALEQAWTALAAGDKSQFDAPTAVTHAAAHLVALDSAPDRGIVLAIAAGTAEDPNVDPGALQEAAGVDRRSQAKALMETLTQFKAAHGLTLKISRDPGVSNPWREPVIDDGWLAGRKLPSAGDFVTLVDWLRAAPPPADRRARAEALLVHLAYLIANLAQKNSLAYPKFFVSPSIAMALVNDFLTSTPNRPDAVEAVACAAARTISEAMPGEISVERGDVNSPDAIDVLVIGDHVATGIEATDEPISLAKLQHEVVPAMLKHGLSHAIVVARPPISAEAEAVAQYVREMYQRFGQRIDVVEIADIELWFSLPGLPSDVATKFIWEIGPELDRYSATETRRAWFDVLSAYVETASKAPDSP